MKIIKVLIFILLILLIVISFFTYKLMYQPKRNIVGDLEIKENYQEKEDSFFEIDNLDYDEMFVESKENVKTTGRYSDTTPDGKIQWNENHYYGISTKLPDVFSDVRLNGQLVSLPTNFEKLGWDYAPFQSIKEDYLKDEKMPLHFKNIKNQVYLEIIPFKLDTNIDKEDEDSYYNDYNDFIGFMYNRNKRLFSLYLSFDKGQKKILGFYKSIDSGVETLYDLKIQGIGVGSTFNEAYEVFGTPYKIEINGDKRKCTYKYRDFTNVTFYGIICEHNTSYVPNAKTGKNEYVHNNVITSIYCFKSDL